MGKRILPCTVFIAWVACFFCTTTIWAGQATPPHERRPTPIPTEYSPTLVLHGGGALTAKASPDSFYLYGGPGTLEGKFEGAHGQYDRQGWEGVDLTERVPQWQLSLFNSPTGTQAAWCGATAEAQPDWISPPGYGNNWDELLEFRFEVPDSLQSTDVRWTFTFNRDSEPIYDFFTATWDSAGTELLLVELDGTNKDSLGVFTPVTADFTFTIPPESYAGPEGKEVALRFRFTSDGGWSDQDGIWPTEGAVQIDDVTVDLGAHGAFFDDFESDFGNWLPTRTDFFGDFSKVLPLIADLDPCSDNTTPQMMFIDDGTPPNNAPNRSTGGTTSVANGYGVPGGFVVNFNGGLTNGSQSIDNRVHSPKIDFDLPGPEDDDAVGALLFSFDTWHHLPAGNGMFPVWKVRSTADPAGETGWTDWEGFNFVYYGGGGVGVYSRRVQNVSSFIDFPTVQKVQLSLGVYDVADLFAFPGNDATPSPTYDNVSLQKARAAGPILTTRAIDLLMGGFSPNGTIPGQYDGPDGPFDETEFAIRLDRARAINGAGTLALPGDSLSVRAIPAFPGTGLAGLPTLHYRLFANPAFDHVRDAGIYDNLVSALPGPKGSDSWNVWEGTIDGDSTRTNSGSVVHDEFQFDVGFDGPYARASGLLGDPAEPAGFFPGDWFFYYVQAVDTGGNTTTIPRGVGAGSPPNNWPRIDVEGGTIASIHDLSLTNYDGNWRVRGLPTIDKTGRHPPVLFINDAFGFGNQPEWDLAWRQNGYVRGVDYDEYVVLGPSSGVDNGIGGIHGATAEQLSGYSTLFYDSAGLSSILLSDGTDATASVDRGDDQGVLTAWHQQDADRHAAFFGDFLCSFLTTNGVSFLTGVLGAELGSGGANVRPTIDDQNSPRVTPTSGFSSVFEAGFVANGGCPAINQFDDLRPLTGSTSTRTHEFLAPSGAIGVYPSAAGIWFERQEAPVATLRTRIDVTFPFGFHFIQGPATDVGPADGRSARAIVLGELLAAFGESTSNLPTNVDVPRFETQLSQNTPNPFNPTTTISFSVAMAGPARLRVLDLRGRVVRTLVDDALSAGQHEFVFDGRDNRGLELASGVYLYQLETNGKQLTEKLAMVK